MSNPSPSRGRFTRGLLLLAFLFHPVFVHNASADIVTEITSSGLHTDVSPPVTLPNGQISHDITGGTRPGGGPNLFHSFGEFSVGDGHIANFLNDSGLATKNILGRVTDGNPSSIFGTLQTTGFGNANLFLLNPAGVIFGPHASLNVGGSLHVTTANYLKLADGVQFTAIPGPQDALLSVASVTAFGFLGPGSPSAIAVEGSTLTVKNGKTLSLIGGNSPFPDPENPGVTVSPGVTIAGGKLTATGGQINLVDVDQPASATIPGEITLNGPGQPVGVSQTGLTSVASLIVSKGTQETTIDMSGTGPSAIRIRGGQLVMDNWHMEVFSPITGQAAGIDVAVDTRADLSNSSLSTNGGYLDSGAITITTPKLSLVDSRVSTNTNGFGAFRAGSITLNVEKLTMRDSRINVVVDFCCSSMLGAPLTIQGLQGAGTKADDVSMSGGHMSSGGFGGSIDIFAKAVELKDGAALRSLTAEANPGAPISLTVDTLKLKDGSRIETGSDPLSNKPAPPITITASQSIDIKDSSRIIASTQGSARGGDITITSQNLTLSNSGSIESKAIANSFNPFGLASGGNVILNVGNLTLKGGAQVNVSSEQLFTAFTTGSAGHITVQGRGGEGTRATSVDISGESSGLFSEARSLGSSGGITVHTNNFALGNDATISAATSSADPIAAGGVVDINAKEIIISNGASITAESTGAGHAGHILVTAHDNLLINKGLISTKSSGVGDAGSILLEAGNNLIINKSTVSAESTGTGQVGSIQLRSGHLILLNNSIVTPFPLIDLYATGQLSTP